jgi:hypothetical protein
VVVSLAPAVVEPEADVEPSAPVVLPDPSPEVVPTTEPLLEEAEPSGMLVDPGCEVLWVPELGVGGVVGGVVGGNVGGGVVGGKVGSALQPVPGKPLPIGSSEGQVQLKLPGVFTHVAAGTQGLSRHSSIS